LRWECDRRLRRGREVQEIDPSHSSPFHELVPLRFRLTNPKVAERAADISGRFRVIRAEIGSTTMSLRDIVCSVLEDGLAGLGVTYIAASALPPLGLANLDARRNASFQPI
jgi:hypothetical protein